MIEFCKALAFHIYWQRQKLGANYTNAAAHCVHVLIGNLLYELSPRNIFQLVVLYRFGYSRLIFSGLSEDDTSLTILSQAIFFKVYLQ